MKSKLTQWLNHRWYTVPTVPFFLKPLSWIYAIIQQLHRQVQLSLRKPESTPPVIVIGNLTVGGTGKTPFLIALAQRLLDSGYRIGIVTRGYHNQLSSYPYLVQAYDSAQQIGDEAKLISQKVQAPLVIAPKRQEGVRLLASQFKCDFILSDDGLQHYRMPRAMEIVMIDGQRGFGNNELLPVGPLREPLWRLKKADFILINGTPSDATQQSLKKLNCTVFQMDLKNRAIEPLHAQTPPFSTINSSIAAFAGIGNPTRFFQSLQSAGIHHQPYSFADHHHFIRKDFEIPETCIIMTEKDAMKCQSFTDKPIYVLAVEACMQHQFWTRFFSHPLFKSQRIIA
jgi:tetraacyldisaccharide 4'-kinase